MTIRRAAEAADRREAVLAAVAVVGSLAAVGAASIFLRWLLATTRAAVLGWLG